ncbi:MAG: hypothetical protein ABIQ35_07850 [Verrucomicrobiota bacterium]
MGAPDSEALDNFLGEEVVDPAGRIVGTFSCYWEHDDGVPVLLGIDILETPARTHVAPAKGARLDDRKSYVVISFTKEKVQEASCLECGSELDTKFEEQVFAYYGDDAFGYKRAGAESVRKELRRKAHGGRAKD